MSIFRRAKPDSAEAANASDQALPDDSVLFSLHGTFTHLGRRDESEPARLTELATPSHSRMRFATLNITSRDLHFVHFDVRQSWPLGDVFEQTNGLTGTHQIVLSIDGDFVCFNVKDPKQLRDFRITLRGLEDVRAQIAPAERQRQLVNVTTRESGRGY